MSSEIEASSSSPSTAPPYRLSFRGLVRSELVKLATVRSSLVLLCLTALLAGAISVAVGILTETAPGSSLSELTATFVNSTLTGMQLAVLVVAALAAVAGATDFGNGTIGLAFAAAPRRTPVLLAKLIAVGGASGALVTATLLATALINAYALSPATAPSLLLSSSTLLGVAGAVLATVGVAVSAVALGCLLRSSAGAIFAILGLLVVLTIVLMAVPGTLVPPSLSAYGFGAAVTTLLSGADDASAWLRSGLAVAAWSASLTAAAAVQLRRRDV